MRLFIPTELDPRETRSAMLPGGVAKLVKLGAVVEVEAGLGRQMRIADADYVAAGAKVATSRASALAEADTVLRVRKPPLEEISGLKRGCLHVSFLDSFREAQLVEALGSAGVSAVSMELIPRSTVAQKMDALSSQANLAGYAAVTLAASRLDRIFPMMSTPSGTISPAKVFIIGAGVAGLQAIATARRLGAVVEAFDTRPAVEEQVKSLGARFVKVDLGELGQTAQGYARELTPEQLALQREAMARSCAQADVVITTAQIFGKKAPLIVTQAILAGMKPGSLVVDLAVESGGNVEGSKIDEEVEVNGVRILGHANLPGRVPRAASEMYANNLVNFVTHFWDAEKRGFRLDPEAPILRDCLVTHAGAVLRAPEASRP
jgi:NAD(P) transhydrogenase subunit alpha